MRIVGLVFSLLFGVMALIGWTMGFINHSFSIYPLIFNLLQLFFILLIVFGDKIDELLDFIYRNR